MTPDPDTTETPEAPPAKPGFGGPAIGGALVVAILGGIIGGIIATAPRTATPAPTPSVVEPAPVPEAEPSMLLPTQDASTTPSGTPEPEPAEPEPSASPTPEPAPTPTPRATTNQPRPTASGRAHPSSRVDPLWLDQVASKTGIPRRAVEAYAAATLTLQREKAACSLGWNTLAAIGQIESRHGSYGGAKLGTDGVVNPRVIGPALDGKGFASIPDTDGGALDGDSTWDRAVGPMQFIPSTWKAYGADGNGDGVKDPHNIDDAALAAARYLCARGGMDSAGGWRSSVLGYNRSEQYISDVARVANDYAQKVAG